VRPTQVTFSFQPLGADLAVKIDTTLRQQRPKPSKQHLHFFAVVDVSGSMGWGNGAIPVLQTALKATAEKVFAIKDAEFKLGKFNHEYADVPLHKNNFKEVIDREIEADGGTVSSGRAVGGLKWSLALS